AFRHVLKLILARQFCRFQQAVGRRHFRERLRVGVHHFAHGSAQAFFDAAGFLVGNLAVSHGGFHRSEAFRLHAPPVRRKQLTAASSALLSESALAASSRIRCATCATVMRSPSISTILCPCSVSSCCKRASFEGLSGAVLGASSASAGGAPFPPLWPSPPVFPGVSFAA